eukprot:2319485-Rhodomonas_salina.2
MSETDVERRSGLDGQQGREDRGGQRGGEQEEGGGGREGGGGPGGQERDDSVVVERQPHAHHRCPGRRPCMCWLSPFYVLTLCPLHR